MITYKHIALSLIILSFPVIAFAESESGRFTETHNKTSNEVDKNKPPNKWGENALAIKKLYPVQVLLTINRDNAMSQVSKLTSIGYSGAYFRPVKGPDNNTYYRVFAGNFPSEEEAIRVTKKINSYPDNRSSFVRRDFQ